jgi:hypothetical protein
VRDDSVEAREAINHLYRNELRWFQNLFLPSVKLAPKERVGSRWRRRYEAPQTPLQRLVASGAADAVKLAGLQRRRDRLDPFQLSASIEAQLKKIFALSREAPVPSTTPVPVERASVDTGAKAAPVAQAAFRRPQPDSRSSSDSRKKQSRSVSTAFRDVRAGLVASRPAVWPFSRLTAALPRPSTRLGWINP